MHGIGLIGGIVCLAIWIYLLVGHGDFWKIWRLLAPERPTDKVNGMVAAIIPARNEAVVIGATVRSLLSQSCTGSIHIIVVDDHSSDGTAKAAWQAARDCGCMDSVTVVTGSELPTGWTGKLWAVQQGIERAAELNPAFLLLTDADIQHSPDNVATLVATAQNGNYDLTSFMVKLHCRSLAERLLIPPFVFFFFMLYPPNRVRDPRRKIAAAAGGCMLIRPKALEKAGGIVAIRGQIIDDCALAKAVKRSGGRVRLGLTADTHSIRVYGSFGEIERMVARTAFNQLQHSVLMLMGALTGLAITYLLPLGLILSCNLLLMRLGLLCWLVMALAYAPMVKFYGLNLAWAVTLPFSACFYMAATIHSAFKYWSGRGGEWKGRAQDVVSTD